MIRNTPGQILPVYLEDAAGNPVTGVIPAAGELRLTLSGNTLQDGTGVWTEGGSGKYTYEMTQPESDTPGYVGILVTVPNAKPYPYVDEAEGSLLPTSSAEARRVPVWVADVLGNGLEGLDAEILYEIAFEEGDFEAISGTHGEAGGGFYYYENTSPELDYRLITLKATHDDAEDYVYAYSAAGVTSDTTAPELIVVSPTPGATPGSVGGFPASRAVADLTPVVLKIYDVNPGLRYACVTLPADPVLVDGVTVTPEEVVYRRGQFRGRFVAGSTQRTYHEEIEEEDTVVVELSIRRLGGWPRTPASLIFSLDMVDQSGNQDS